ESNFAFLQRQLAEAGVFYWFEVDAAQRRERLCVADHNSGVSPLPRAAVPYRAAAGQAAAAGGRWQAHVDRLAPGWTAGGRRHAAHVQSEPPTARPQLAGEADADVVHFAPPLAAFAAAQQQVTLDARRDAVQAFQLTAAGPVPELAPGRWLHLEASHFRAVPGLSGEYLVTAVTHRFDPETGYRGEATLIPRRTPYVAPAAPRPRLPFMFTARIETPDRYGLPDAAGRGAQPVRPDFERGAHRHTEATPPLRRLSPYAGAGRVAPSGFFCPLTERCEVLLHCPGGDPNQALILGIAPNKDAPGPVGAANAPHNRWLTPGQNEVLFDDELNRSHILLQTFAGQVKAI
ncbi:contractile injection system protein, VgrG/Pvc8 family, partial [Alkalilimnicola ehrlichii]